MRMARTAESIFAGDGGAFPFAEGSAAPPDLAETLSSMRGEKSGTLSFGNESGFGEMRLVEVLPGVSVSFNDFGMDGYLSTFSTASDVLCVDWCRDGRIEQPMPDGSYAYVSAGDLKVGDRTRHSGSFAFPTSRYRGITISFDLSCAPASIRRALPGFSVDLRELKRRFCRDGRPFIVRDCARMRHIAEELYESPVHARRAYCQIKALETLLLLDSIDPGLEGADVAYYPRSRVARVKKARELMVSDLSSCMTVEEAARRAGMSLTSFKECFKGVYGTSPAAYVRGVRMGQAAKMLAETDMPVAEVGALAGYDSPSKFSVAFKSSMGATPSGYRHLVREPGFRPNGTAAAERG